MEEEYTRSIEVIDEDLWLVENKVREMNKGLKLLKIYYLIVIVFLLLLMAGEIWIFIMGP